MQKAEIFCGLIFVSVFGLGFKLPQELFPESQENKHKPVMGIGSIQDSSPSSLLTLAKIYKNKGDYKNQIRILKNLTAKEPENGSYLLHLAQVLVQVYSQTSKPQYKEQAIDTINNLLELDKKHHEKANLLLLKLLKHKDDIKNNHYAILTQLQTMVRKFGMKPVYVRDTCKYLYINEFYRQARLVCKKAVSQNKKLADNYVYYGLSLKDPLKKLKYLKNIAKKFPHSLIAQEQLGKLLLDRQEYESAYIYYRQAVKLSSQSVSSRIGLAQTLFNMNYPKKAYVHFVKACALDKIKALPAFKTREVFA